MECFFDEFGEVVVEGVGVEIDFVCLLLCFGFYCVFEEIGSGGMGCVYCVVCDDG